MLRALNGDPIKNFQLFEKEESIETIRLFLGNGVSWQIKDDKFVQTR